MGTISRAKSIIITFFQVLNILQSCSMAFDVVDENNVFTCVGHPLKSDISSIVDWMLNENFSEAYNKIQKLKILKGLSLQVFILLNWRGVYHRYSICTIFFPHPPKNDVGVYKALMHSRVLSIPYAMMPVDYRLGYCKFCCMVKIFYSLMWMKIGWCLKGKVQKIFQTLCNV